MRTFLETDFSSYQGYVVILDIDGVLVSDGEADLDERVRSQVTRLGQVNDVYLCSNGGYAERDKKFAELTGATWLSSSAAKPNLKVIKGLIITKQPVLVIGDKMLTDGLLAYRLHNASFIKVKRPVVKSTRSIFSSSRWTEVVDDIITAVWAMIKIIRPVQHVRNLLILVPAFFAGQLFSSGNLITALISIVTFSLLVGFIYIINDIIDYKSDLRHPVKRKRPLTSGLISKRATIFGAILLLSIAVVLCYFFVPSMWWLMVVYGLLNILYSVSFKHIIILDILTIAAFYIIRILIGGVVFGVPISAWLVLTILFSSLFFAVGKRRSAMRNTMMRNDVNQHHNLSVFFDMLLAITVAISLLSYGVYTVLKIVSPLAPYTIILIVYILFKYLYVLSTTSLGESPERLIISQPDIILSIIGWFGLMGYIVHLQGAQISL